MGWFFVFTVLAPGPIQCISFDVNILICSPLRWQQEPIELENSGQRAYHYICNTKNIFFIGFNNFLVPEFFLNGLLGLG